MKEDNQCKFVQAMKDNNFSVSKACASIDISRSTYYKWMESDPEFKQVMDDFREEFIDLAETVLVRAMKADDTDASKFILKHLARKRGYAESSNVDHTSGGERITGIVVEIINKNKDEAEHKGDAPAPVQP